MGQKNNPLALRIQSSTRYFDHAWYSSQYFSKLIGLDLQFLHYFDRLNSLQKIPKPRTAIFHDPKISQLYIFLCYPKYSRESGSKTFGLIKSLHALSSKHVKNFPFHQFEIYKHKFLSHTTNPHLPLVSTVGALGDATVRTALSTFVTTLTTLAPKIKGLPVPDHHTSGHQYTTHDILENFQHILAVSRLSQSYAPVSEVLQPCDLAHQKNLPSEKYTSILHGANETHVSKFLRFPVAQIYFRSDSEWQDAGYFADELVYLLERRIPFKRIKKKILAQITAHPYVQGLRILCSGRVGGKSKKAQRAKADSLKYGQTSLHVFSSKIDYASRTAHTLLGSMGVKVWISYK